MQGKKNFFSKMADWLFVGARLPIVLVLILVLSVTVITTSVVMLNKEDTSYVTAFVTVKGFGDDVDFANRQIKIEDGDSIKNIFSYKYKNIYEDFGKPLVQYNEFKKFLGYEAIDGKSFSVKIDGKFDTNLELAYVYEGQTITIEYV